MKRIALAATVLVTLAVGQADAQHKRGDGLTVRTATIDSRSGSVIPAVTRLHPVIGSVQRTGHITNPFTHKAKYSATTYNPLTGTFGKQTFRR